MREWYKVAVSASAPDVAEVDLLDYIGSWGDEYFMEGGGPGVVTAKGFLQALSALPDSVKSIKVRINSPGGDVSAAATITNALRDQKVLKGRTVEVQVDGLAASAASMIMMAGDPIRVSDNAIIMVHNPWSIAIGNSADMRKEADTLDTFRDSIVATYQRSQARRAEPLTPKDIMDLMDAETWMSAQEAVDYGFADEVIPAAQVSASFLPSAVKRLNIPEKYRDKIEAMLTRREEPAAETKPESAMQEVVETQPAAEAKPESAMQEVVETPVAVTMIPPPALAAAADFLAPSVKRCAVEGLSAEFAASLLDAKDAAEVNTRIDAAVVERKTEADRVARITAIGKQFHQEDLAQRLASARVSVKDAEGIVQSVLGQFGRVEVPSGGRSPDLDPASASAPNTVKVYEGRNRKAASRKEK